MQHPPIDAVAEIPQWTKHLKGLAAQPLTMCPDFPRIAERFEAWWSQQIIDRPIFLAHVNTNPARPILRRPELLADPQRWFESKLADLKQLKHVGDAIPNIRVDFGPVMLGALVGGRVEFVSDTTWTHPCIDDQWSNEPDWTIREDHAWWKLLTQLTDRVSRDAAGKYLVCTPDLGGSADVLLNLRGSEPLCMDVLERPERVERAVHALYPAWRKVWRELYRVSHSRGAGLFHWLHIWSSQPYMVPACDFNYMISPEDFQHLFLPDIARQAATAGRAVFHLDGPGAARHIDALLEVPEIQAIQFTPGSGSPPAVRWIDMFRKIQSKGRSVFIFALKSDLAELCEALRPEGLAISLQDRVTPAELDDLFAQFCRRYGASR